MNDKEKYIKILLYLLPVVIILAVIIYVVVDVFSFKEKIPVISNNLNLNTKKGENSNNINGQITDLFNQNKFAEANTILDEQLVKNDKDINLLLQKAQTLAQEASITFKEKELGDKAMSFIEQVLRLDPKNVQALTLKGYVYEIQQDYTNAHKYYDQALAIDPNNAETLVQKAHAYFLEGKEKDSQKYYELAIKADSNSLTALSGLAKIYANSGKLTQAKDLFIKVGKETANARLKSESYYSASVIAERIKPFDAADLEYLVDKAIESDPSYAMPYVSKANLEFAKSFSSVNSEEKQRFIQSSFAYLEKALLNNPKQSIAHFQLAINMNITGRKEETKLVLKNLPSIVKNDITLSEKDKELMLLNIKNFKLN